jgi:hypothetical protein
VEGFIVGEFGSYGESARVGQRDASGDANESILGKTVIDGVTLKSLVLCGELDGQASVG